MNHTHFVVVDQNIFSVGIIDAKEATARGYRSGYECNKDSIAYGFHTLEDAKDFQKEICRKSLRFI